MLPFHNAGEKRQHLDYPCFERQSQLPSLISCQMKAKAAEQQALAQAVHYPYPSNEQNMLLDRSNTRLNF